MSKLKLSAIPDDRPVKITVELPSAAHRDLVPMLNCSAARPDKTDSTDADPVHHNKQSIRQGTTDSETG
ncbi:DUF2274 domain-containing protein [Mesorhizobium sp. M0522]|uniref:DUF2274 domain-containing protein n=1 Tax=unclassified Mesorhizobium TaxID=325217 RepID=UPI003335ABB8